MGWLFMNNLQEKADIVEHLVKGIGDRYVEHRVVGNHAWFLVKDEITGNKLIVLALLSKSSNGWGYKDIDETMGPYHYDCPLTLLAKADPPMGAYATEWRNKVRAHRAKKAKRITLGPGAHVLFGGFEYELVVPAGPRKGWHVRRVSDGAAFRMPASYLTKAEVVA